MRSFPRPPSKVRQSPERYASSPALDARTRRPRSASSTPLQKRRCNENVFGTPQQRRKSFSNQTPPGKAKAPSNRFLGRSASSPAKSTPPLDRYMGSPDVRSPDRDCGGSFRRGSGSRQRPNWDFTNSDMGRYKLNPAEQLRRQLTRMSKHHDEAAASLQWKLQQMQENIAPFLADAAPTSPEESFVKPTSSHMSPCFASKVPTGRIPVPELGSSDSKKGRRPLCCLQATEVPVRRGRRSDDRYLEYQYGHEGQEDEGDQFTHVKVREDRLGEALEAEINEFLYHGSTSSAPSRPSPGKPKYHVLRRSPTKHSKQSESPNFMFVEPLTAAVSSLSPDPVGSMTMTPATPETFHSQQRSSGSRWQHSSGEWTFGKPKSHRPLPEDLKPVSLFANSSVSMSMTSMPFTDSDSELGEIEEQAGQLEEQLAWWSRQRDILRKTSKSSDSKEHRDEDSSEELAAQSEWLQLPCNSARSFRSDANSEIGGEKTIMDILIESLGENLAGRTLGATETQNEEAAKLSELISRQAADLVAEAMLPSNLETNFATTSKEVAGIEMGDCTSKVETQPDESGNGLDISHGGLQDGHEDSQREAVEVVSPAVASQRAKALVLAQQWASELASSNRSKALASPHVKSFVVDPASPSEAPPDLSGDVKEVFDADAQEDFLKLRGALSMASLAGEAFAEVAACGLQKETVRCSPQLKVSGFEELFNL
eukprot:TRINITY_DN115099_c0_g1_i1.p1 TRINITY_DN115099_c0_g1~~TRINITY_DN115099_c0_g1_i1.p1  ORF type:complete len:711 (-),score=138.95 TRINITY_DN115099_c0_g1_i1:52-2184(-)